jgi:hypothetical protein
MSNPANQKVRGGYEEVETLDDPGGAHAVISQRVGHNVYTAAFFRKFERDGIAERTAFFGPDHFESLKRMIDTAQKRITELSKREHGRSANLR